LFAVTSEELGPFIKDVRSKVKTEGVLQLRMFALFGAKNFDFSEFMVCPHGQ